MTEHDDLQAEIEALEQQLAEARALRARVVENRMLPEDLVRFAEFIAAHMAELERAEQEGPEAVEALYESESPYPDRAPRLRATRNRR